MDPCLIFILSIMDIEQSRINVEKLLNYRWLVLNFIYSIKTRFIRLLSVQEISKASPFHILLHEVHKLAVTENIIDLYNIRMDRTKLKTNLADELVEQVRRLVYQGFLDLF